MPDYIVRSFYRFAPLGELRRLQRRLRELCDEERITGTILLADEGINGSVCGSPRALDRLFAELQSIKGLAGLDWKEGHAQSPPFHRLKVRLKKEIVSMGDPEVDPVQRVGTYVDPTEWNVLIRDPQVVVVDTRNAYEVRVGTFDGAVDPQLASFRDFPAWASKNLDPARHRKVAMFCTGGIRCEKATSLLLREGFDEVFHLRGGILDYLAAVPESESAWRGECFVFDNRVAVDHALEPGQHTLCFGCKEPLSVEDTRAASYEPGVCCPYCVDRTSEALKERRRERSKQVALARERGETHIGAVFPQPGHDDG